MNKWLAAIDIGSNSVRLLTCQRAKTGLINRRKQVNTTQLARGVDQTKRLAESRIAATIAVLRDYAAQLTALGITKCPVFATSAVRDAVNRADFVARVKAQTKFDIAILSGEQEAAYGFLGVVKGSVRPAADIVVIDVGGGSTELIFGNKDGKINFAHSFDIGAVRMTDRFQLGHAMPPAAFLPIERALFKQCDAQKIKDYCQVGSSYIAIGGTATSLAAIDLQLAKYDAAAVQQHQMTARRLRALTEQLITATREQKLKLAGLAAARVDIIGAGAAIIDSALRYLDQPLLSFSDYDNLEGALFMFDKVESES